MKGLEISRRFFLEWGLPFIRREFPELTDRIAAGLSGGSDVIGADDKLSQDHAWGPRFELWLTTEDFRRCARSLNKRINEAAPETFLGFRHHFFGDKRDPVSVESTDRFFEWFGWRNPPQRPSDWFKRRGGDALVDKESWLYFMKHAPVYYDPLGEFTARKAAFSHYPRDVRYKLIADLCLGVWALGEYKFCCRHVHRKDPVAIHICLGLFVQEAMRLCFLINDDYAPHEVWIHHEFRKLPEYRTVGPKIRRLVASSDLDEQRELVLQICAYLRRRLRRAGLVDSEKPDYGLRCRDVRSRIEDTRIRKM